jgi:hypothetical protein
MYRCDTKSVGWADSYATSPVSGLKLVVDEVHVRI